MLPGTRAMFTDLGGEVLALAEALEQDVPPLVFERIIALVTKASDEASDQVRTECDEAVARTLAHFPGIAPAWWAVAAHLRDEFAAPCLERGKLDPHCQLRPLEEPA